MIHFLYRHRHKVFILFLIVLSFVLTGDPRGYLGELWDSGWRGMGAYILLLAYVYYLVRGGVFMLRWWYHERKVDDLVFLEVSIPRNDSRADYERRGEKDFREKVQQMEQFYRALTELSEVNLWNMLNALVWDFDKISFELVLEDQQLRFVIVVDKYYRSIVEKQVTSFYTSANLEPTQGVTLSRPGYHVNGYYLHLQNPFWFPVKFVRELENDPLNDVANAFSKVAEDEKAVLQVIVNPLADQSWRKIAQKKADKFFKREKEWHIPVLSRIPIIGTLIDVFFAIFSGNTDQLSGQHNAPGAMGGDPFIRMVAAEEEVAKRMGEKGGEFGFRTVVRILTSAKTAERSHDLLNSMIVSMSVYKDGLSNWWQNRRIIPIDVVNSPLILHGFLRRLGRFSLSKTSILVPQELAALYHFPDGKYNDISIIKWLPYKVLPPPPDAPDSGLLLGNNFYRGQKSPIYMHHKDRSRHFYIIGKSGTGKSALISNMARQDISEGHGICVVDPHGDLVEDILQYVPKERAKDVIYFDPADVDRPMGLNLLEANSPEEKDRASLDAMNIFLKLFGNEIFGPRIQHYFRNGCLTLMDDEDEGATLIDLPRLFTDEDYQKYKVSKTKNTVVRQFWENEIAKTGAREKEEMIPYFSSKFGPFVTNTTMRNIIGQHSSAFDLRRVMDDGKILLVNLSKGRIGDINAQLLGLIFVNKISMAAMQRADMREEDRRDFFLYVDEFQNFATDAFADILSEARKYKLNLTMAHQYIAQLQQTQNYEKQSQLRDAVFGNVGTMMSFRVGAEDAEYLEKEYTPYLTQQDIIGITNYKAYAKINVNNSMTKPFSMMTIWDTRGRNAEAAELIKRYSRLKYGRRREFVDEEIEARLGIVG